ncbi:hypothetical protein CSUI_006818, partial [Cystoisospora suis]
ETEDSPGSQRGAIRRDSARIRLLWSSSFMRPHTTPAQVPQQMVKTAVARPVVIFVGSPRCSLSKPAS